MKNLYKGVLASAGIAVLLAAGCKKTADVTVNYRKALDTYYAAHPACVWTEMKRFPVQVTTSDTVKTSDYDALYDQGLLTRTTAEKKVFILGSKQVTNYDLSDKGRSSWTADPTQPGYGNFCYGHRTVQSIVSATPNSGQPGATTQVTYRYGVADPPAWALATEVQTAFPEVQADLGGSGTAVTGLLDTEAGWQVQAPKQVARPATNADGKIVE